MTPTHSTMSDEQTVGPALTPEQWRQAVTEDAVFGVALKDASASAIGDYADSGSMDDAANRHALAALCLYGQPFGFTQEDVNALRGLFETFARDGEWFSAGEFDRFASLAARIAALLPPEPKATAPKPWSCPMCSFTTDDEAKLVEHYRAVRLAKTVSN